MNAHIPDADLPILDKRHALVEVDLPIAQEGNYRVIGARIHEFDTPERSP